MSVTELYNLESHWRELVEAPELLSERRHQQQNAIWELVHTEADFLHTLKVITDVSDAVVRETAGALRHIYVHAHCTSVKKSNHSIYILHVYLITYFAKGCYVRYNLCKSKPLSTHITYAKKSEVVQSCCYSPYRCPFRDECDQFLRADSSRRHR